MHTILERASVAKAGARSLTGAGDDRVVVTPHHLAVLDGETTKGGPVTTTACVDAVAAAVWALDPAAPAPAALHELSLSVRPLIAAAEGAWTPGTSAAIVSLARRELWVVGSVLHRIDPPGQPYGTGRWHHARHGHDAPAAGRRAALLRRHLAAGATPARLAAADPGRALILDELRDARRWRNGGGPHAFASLDGTPIPPRLLEVRLLPRAACHLTLASDGYLPTPGNLAAAEARLQAALVRDPLCIGLLQGTKGVTPGHVSFDDRSWLAVQLPPAP